MIGGWTIAELWRDRPNWWGANFTWLQFCAERGEMLARRPNRKGVWLPLYCLPLAAFAIVVARELALLQPPSLQIIILVIAALAFARRHHFCAMSEFAAIPVSKNLPNPSMLMATAAKWAIPFFSKSRGTSASGTCE